MRPMSRSQRTGTLPPASRSPDCARAARAGSRPRFVRDFAWFAKLCTVWTVPADWMSFSTDLLSASTPTRLFCHAGRWVLELSRLEAVDRNVFQPRTQRLEGPDAILTLLRRSNDGVALAN